MTTANRPLLRCPVRPCRWALDATPPAVPAEALASVFGLGTMSHVAFVQHAQDVEQAIARHLKDHRLEDLVGALKKANTIVDALVASWRDLRHVAATAEQFDRFATLDELVRGRPVAPEVDELQIHALGGRR